MHVERVWHDVNFGRNHLVQRKACLLLGIDPNQYDAAILGELLALNERAKLQRWIPLSIYNVMQDNLVTLLGGHPWRLREVGWCAAETTFGGMEALQLFIHRLFLKYLTSPLVGIAKLCEATHAWHCNKRWLLHRCTHNSTFIVITYPEGPNGIRRTPFEDRRSVLYYIRGILEKIPRMWARQPDATLEYRVCQVPLLQLLAAEAPELTLEFDRRVLKVNGDVVAKVVFLEPDEQVIYTGTYSERSTGKKSLPALLITRTIRTPCQNGKLLPLALEGEIYAIDDNNPLPATVIYMGWKTDWVRRVVERAVPDIARAFQRSIELLEEASDAAVVAAELREQAEYGLKVMALRFPNLEIAKQVRDQEFGDRRPDGTYSGVRSNLDIMVCMDIVGSVAATEKAKQLGRLDEHDEKSRRMYRKIAQLAREYFLWFYNFTGDGGLIQGTIGAMSANPTAPLTIQQMADRVVAFVRALHAMVYRETGWKIRVGIHYGENRWSVEEEDSSLHARGEPCNISMRMQAAAPNEGTLATPAFVALVTNKEQFGPQIEVPGKRNEPMRPAHVLLPETEASPVNGQVPANASS